MFSVEKFTLLTLHADICVLLKRCKFMQIRVTATIEPQGKRIIG